jgi:RHS repeat-associated protein
MMQDSDGNRTDYVFDAVGRLIGVWAPNFDYVAYAHDAGGRVTEKWYSNGVTSRNVWNLDDSLASLTNRSASTTVLTSHAYQCDTLGRRYRHTETIGSLGTNYWQYGFDPLSRLSSVNSCTSSSYATCAAQETDSYDALDNRVSKTTPAGTLAYVYDPANQLTEIHQDSPAGALLAGYVWDANSDLSQKCSGGSVTRSAASCSGVAMQNLSFDPEDRLTSVNLVGSVTEAYAYDSQGRRIAKNVNGLATNYVYQGDDIAAEYGSTWGAPQAVYTHGGGIDEPLVRLTGQTNQPTASASYYHQDGLGSVVGMSGAASGVQRFDAWGNQTQFSGSAIAPYGYTGREPTDPALGLVYYRARYYDPSIGRFISRDPAGMPDGVNRYAYVSSNPVSFNDPSGKCIGPLIPLCPEMLTLAMEGFNALRASEFVSAAVTAARAAIAGNTARAALTTGTIGAASSTVGYLATTRNPTAQGAVINGGVGFVTGAAVPLLPEFAGFWANAGKGAVLAGGGDIAVQEISMKFNPNQSFNPWEVGGAALGGGLALGLTKDFGPSFAEQLSAASIGFAPSTAGLAVGTKLGEPSSVTFSDPITLGSTYFSNLQGMGGSGTQTLLGVSPH